MSIAVRQGFLSSDTVEYRHIHVYLSSSVILLSTYLSSINHAFIIYPSFTIIYLATIYLSNSTIYLWPSVVARGEALPAMQRTWVLSVGLEDPLEEAIATLCNILAWRIPWTEEPGGLQSMVEKSPT